MTTLAQHPFFVWRGDLGRWADPNKDPTVERDWWRDCGGDGDEDTRRTIVFGALDVESRPWKQATVITEVSHRQENLVGDCQAQGRTVVSYTDDEIALTPARQIVGERADGFANLVPIDDG